MKVRSKGSLKRGGMEFCTRKETSIEVETQKDSSLNDNSHFGRLRMSGSGKIERWIPTLIK